MIRASDNRDALANTLTTVDARVSSSYQRYLETLDTYRVEVLAQWRATAVFIGPRTAHRVRRTLPALSTSAAEKPREETAVVRGCFQGFLRSKGFEFLDLDSGKKYAGTISKQFGAQLPDEIDLVLDRASERRYIATIRVRRTLDGSEKHQLLDYRGAGQSEGRDRTRGLATYVSFLRDR